MNPSTLFKQKREIAKATLRTKVKIHGLCCSVEVPKFYFDEETGEVLLNKPYLNVYGEESGHIEYVAINHPNRVLVVNSTQENMKSEYNPLNSTENSDLYLLMFEDDILPRNSRIKIFMQDGSYRQLQIRDNIKNEGTFVVHQELVPCINSVDDNAPEVGENIPQTEEIDEELNNDNTSIGENL